MNIELNNKYRITSDNQNLILQEKRYPDPNNKRTKDPNQWKWVDVGYYGEFSHLVSALLEKEIRDSDADRLMTIELLIENTAAEIYEVVKEVVK